MRRKKILFLLHGTLTFPAQYASLTPVDILVSKTIQFSERAKRRTMEDIVSSEGVTIYG